MNRQLYMKTNLIMLVIYDSQVEKTNCQITVVFKSCFSLSTVPSQTPTFQPNHNISSLRKENQRNIILNILLEYTLFVSSKLI